MKTEIAVIGAACAIAGTEAGSDQGPLVMQQSSSLRDTHLPLAWDHIIFSRGEARQLDAMDNVIHYSQHIAQRTTRAVKRGEPFLTIGGDHSCAIGTWSGAASQLRKINNGDLGLIWVDAHLDAHTPDSSDTGNIHGMPVAHLLGEGDTRLAHIGDDLPKIKPENLAIIGIRSFEAPEKELADRLGVRVYYIDEVKQRGIDVVLQEAYDRVTANTQAFGFSIDVDGFDPIYAPAVHTTVDDGINAPSFIEALQRLPKHLMIGAEIAEFTPRLDKNHVTEKLVADLTKTLFEEYNVKKPEATTAEASALV